MRIIWEGRHKINRQHAGNARKEYRRPQELTRSIEDAGTDVNAALCRGEPQCFKAERYVRERRKMSQKIENILNLALDATEEERMRSEDLETGYDPIENEWELIVKYSGDLAGVRELASSVTELMNGYAVIVIKESRIERLAGLDAVEFVEKPKNLYFQAENGRRVSCIDTVQNPPFGLSGEGVLVGIVDSGIDYENPDFRNGDGTTRIEALWDQTIDGNPPVGYSRGTDRDSNLWRKNGSLYSNSRGEAADRPDRSE